MRIYFTPGQDPMLLDSLTGINALHERLRRFVTSDETALSLTADRAGSPAPYSELLNGLRIEKRDEAVRLCLTQDRWLQLTGSPVNLERYIGFFRFDDDEEGAHHHPEHVSVAGYIDPGTMSLIIEVDTDWIEEIRTSS